MFRSCTLDRAHALLCHGPCVPSDFPSRYRCTSATLENRSGIRESSKTFHAPEFCSGLKIFFRFKTKWSCASRSPTGRLAPSALKWPATGASSGRSLRLRSNRVPVRPFRSRVTISCLEPVDQSRPEQRCLAPRAHDHTNPPSHFIYIVRCADGTLYTGYARDPAAREKVHNQGRGARYTRGRRPVALAYAEAHRSRSDALKREREVKCWPRGRKEALIANSRVDRIPLSPK